MGTARTSAWTLAGSVDSARRRRQISFRALRTGRTRSRAPGQSSIDRGPRGSGRPGSPAAPALGGGRLQRAASSAAAWPPVTARFGHGDGQRLVRSRSRRRRRGVAAAARGDRVRVAGQAGRRDAARGAQQLAGRVDPERQDRRRLLPVADRVQRGLRRGRGRPGAAAGRRPRARPARPPARPASASVACRRATKGPRPRRRRRTGLEMAGKSWRTAPAEGSAPGATAARSRRRGQRPRPRALPRRTRRRAGRGVREVRAR